MYPWDVLGIDEIDDKKVIKKAYAKLIRQYRPEDAPEKFQEINQAYQYALKLLKNQQTAEGTPPEFKDVPNIQSARNENIVEAVIVEKNEVVNDEIEEELTKNISIQSIVNKQTNQESSEQELLEKKIEEMFELTHQMAFSSMRQRSDLKNWAFLEFFNEIHDIDLRDQIAKELFKRVAEYNLFQIKQNKIKLIPVNVIMYMSEIFQWETNWQEYRLIFPEHYFQINFEDVEKNENIASSKYMPKISTRCIALMVDAFVYFLAAGLIAGFVNLEKFNEGWMFFLGFALFRLITELVSPQRNTVAVMYLGYRFLDSYLNIPNRATSLKRFFWFEVTMIPVYLFFSNLLSGEVGMITLAIYSIAILIFVYIRKGQFPHDYFSNTVAVKKL